MTDKIKQASRVTTLRLAPTKEHWPMIRDASRGAARYCNKHIQSRLGHALKWRVPEDAEKDSLVKHTRQHDKGDIIGSAVYVGCEEVVMGAWLRDGRKIMAGAPLPQWNEGNALALHGHKDRARSGIQIVRSDDGLWYSARMQLFRADHPAGNWHVIPLHKGKGNDRKHELLEAMCEGTVPIRLGRVLVKRGNGKMLLQLTHRIDKTVHAPGERAATLSNWTQDAGDGTVERLLLRIVVGTDGTGRPDNQHLDYTSKLNHLKNLRDNETGLRRRLMASRGRSRHQARDKRRMVDRIGFSDFQKTFLHQWSREMVDWLVSQGAGTLSIALVGGDWPAHELAEKVRYKAIDAGIRIVDPTPGDPAATKAAKGAVKKQQRKARKLRDALREVGTQLGG